MDIFKNIYKNSILKIIIYKLQTPFIIIQNGMLELSKKYLFDQASKVINDQPSLNAI